MGIKNAGPQLRWLMDMMSFLQKDVITIPSEYRDQVLAVKELLDQDESGLITTILDFAIAQASDVNYQIETNNEQLSIILNDWLANINSSLRGKVPTGIGALSKEYFRERWKGSSQLLLRTLWEDVNGFYLPTKLWFVDGEDINLDIPKSGVVTLGDEQYQLRIGKDKYINLPKNKNEQIFIQKPYTSWGAKEVVPFVIQRGLYKNGKMIAILNDKGTTVLVKALEYLLVLKKGSEALAKENHPDFVYSTDDLKAVKKNFSDMLMNRNEQTGTTTYTTNFDTMIEDYIPEYSKVLKAELYSPMEKRILSGLGLVDIVEGTSSSRRESILNPKPLIGEIRSGIFDWKDMLKDVVLTAIDLNKAKHKKYFSDKTFVEIKNTPIKGFLDKDVKTILRSIYDRGCLSKRSFVEVVGEMDYDIEKQRRKMEEKNGDLEVMYPPVVQNLETIPDPNMEAPDSTITPLQLKKTKEKIDPDKEGPESKNFNNAEEETGVVLEGAPYKTIEELPDTIKVLPKDGQDLWMRVFNESFPKGEDYARKVAWSVVKKSFKKDKEGNWSKK